MTDSLDLCPPSLDLCFARGDTVLWTFQVKSGGLPVNINGYTFVLTVDPSAEPEDESGNLFQLSGTITDGPNGIVQFGMSPTEADQTPGEYFYDVEMTDGSGNIRTIVKGKYVFDPDISNRDA